MLNGADLQNWWQAAGAFCGLHGAALPGGTAPLAMLGLLAMGGAAGSLSHCGAMCGPFVLAQTADRLAALPMAALTPAARIRAGLLLPYHAGRLVSYAALGALAGTAGLGAAGLAAGLGALPGAGVSALGMDALDPAWLLRRLLLLAAAAMFLSLALRRQAPALAARLGVAGLLPHAPGWAAVPLHRAAARLAARGGLGQFLRGVMLGFLPCGLVYGALLAATAVASPALGAAMMLAFGAGTVPLLAVIGLAGTYPRWQAGMRAAAPAVLAANALVLATLAFA